jgi:hypothetical protein
MKTNWICSALVAGLVVSMQAPSRADYVVNGGFETKDFTGWTSVNAPSGTDHGVGSGIAHSGSYAAFFGGVTVGSYDQIYQNLATTAGSSYQLSFWLENQGGPPNSFKALWEGTTVYSIMDSNASGYTNIVLTLTASTSGSQLLFESYNQLTQFALDDVSVTLLSVPEPGSLVLAAVGFAGLGLAVVRRRRRAGVAAIS